MEKHMTVNHGDIGSNPVLRALLCSSNGKGPYPLKVETMGSNPMQSTFGRKPNIG